MNSDNPTSTATINGMPHGMPGHLRNEPRVVIHPPSPHDDCAAGPARPARAARRSVMHTAHQPGDCAVALDTFQRALHLEMRRADRTGSPLSLVQYHVTESELSTRGAAFRFLDALSANKRETDVLGFTGPSSLTVLCPATTAEGARHFVAKMSALGFEHGIAATVATYPNCLFDEIAGTSTVQDGAFAASPRHGNNGLDLVDAAAGFPGYFFKRGLDVLGACLALLLVSPLMLATSIAIATTSPGPVIFKQRRLGKDGKPFVFYKFRSMHCGSDDSIHRQYVASLIKGGTAAPESSGEAGNAPIYKIQADPRISRVGRIIRKTSIDELPQLFNVLRGEMSLVGPRPALPYEAENYQSWHLRRVWAMRPGITGLWQVEGRSRVPFDEMVRMDLRYIRHCSLALDLKILLKTVKVVLRCEGAV